MYILKVPIGQAKNAEPDGWTALSVRWKVTYENKC